MSFLPTFSNIVHKLQVEVALFNQLKAGLKESNRKRIPFTSTTTAGAGSYTTVFVAPWDGSVESLIVASATPTTSTGSAYVTFTVANKTVSDAVLLVGDTYINQTELIANQGAAFFNPAPAMSNGARNPQFHAGDVIEVKGATTGSPSGYTPAATFCLLTLTPTDPKASF
jgi:hypothetical protein